MYVCWKSPLRTDKRCSYDDNFPLPASRDVYLQYTHAHTRTDTHNQPFSIVNSWLSMSTHEPVSEHCRARRWTSSTVLIRVVSLDEHSWPVEVIIPSHHHMHTVTLSHAQTRQTDIKYIPAAFFSKSIAYRLQSIRNESTRQLTASDTHTHTHTHTHTQSTHVSTRHTLSSTNHTSSRQDCVVDSCQLATAVQ